MPTIREKSASRTRERRTAQRDALLLSGFSLFALSESEPARLIERAVALIAEGLKVDCCTVLAVEPGGEAFRVAAGHNWPADRVGQRLSPAQAAQSALAIEFYSRSGARSPEAPRPVVIDDLRLDERCRDTFRVRELGVVSSVCVVIPGAGRPYGTLVAHSRALRRFQPAECGFLRAVANVLSAALARSRSLAALEESEGRFRSLAELSSDWYWEQDADLRFTFVSEGFFQKSRIRREDVLGRRRWEFSVGSAVSSSWEAHRAALEAHRPFRDFEFERIEADGTKYYQTVSGNPVFDAEGRFTGYRGTGRDVTGRRRTLAALQESEDRYRDLIEHSQDLICTHELDGRIRSVNPWAANALGYELAELLNMNIRDVLAPQKRAEFADYIARLEQGGVVSGLMLVQTRTGEKRLWKYANTLRTAGVPAPIVRGMAHDVTEQLRAEAKLREVGGKLAASEAQLRAFMDHSSVSMFIKDREGRYRHVNAQFLRNCGLTADKVLGRTTEEVFARPQAEAFLNQDTRVRAMRAPLMEAEEVLWADGVHATLANKFPILDKTGEVAAIGGVITDISERKRMEQALREQRRLLSRAQELAGLGYWEYDRKTRMTTGSGKLRRMFEISAELPGMGPEWSLELIDSGDRERVRAAVQSAIEQGASFELEARVTTIGCRRRVMVISGEGVKDAAGQVSKVIGSCLDITERRRRENALSDAARGLQALSRRLVEAQETERRRLAAELHDQVGQNLTALSINLDIVAIRLHALEGASDAKRRLQDSLALLEATSRCIEGVLDDLRPPMLDDWGIGPTVQWVAEGFARRTRIPAPVQVLGTERRVDPQNELAVVRIVQEALNNVTKHARAANVEITLDWQSGTVQVEVVDDGIGFEHDNLKDRPGLGLVSMRERVDAAHGVLDIESAPGKGTRVRARVPG